MILLQELLKEILAKVLETEKANVVFQNLTFNINELVENKCFVALQKIKAILEDDTFWIKNVLCKLKIVCVLEELGTNCGSRHDFG